jgi:ankyrin repeat protein
MDERSHEELDTFCKILKIFAPDLTLFNDGIQVWPIALINGKVPSELSPNYRYSQDLTRENLELRDSELRNVIALSVHNPLAQDYRGRNGLHCLALITRLLPDTEQPLAARKDILVDMMNRGVDVNAFDFLGATPLHALLSYPRDYSEDNTIAFFTKLMIHDHGADPHLRDRNGNTALHLACKSGRLACIEILLIMGAKC